jgi:hypothetical protein
MKKEIPMAKLSDEELYDIALESRVWILGVSNVTPNTSDLHKFVELLDKKRMGKVDVPPHLAFEFGYKQCEKGNNIQMATDNFNKALNGGK